jgi:hypothetical protein
MEAYEIALLAVYLCPPSSLLGNFPTATNTYETIEEFLDPVISMRFVLYQIFYLYIYLFGL